VLTQVKQAHALRQQRPHRLLHSAGENHLLSVPGGQQPSDPIDVRAEVVVVPLLGRSQVESHSDTDRLQLPPGFISQPALGLDRRLQGRRRRRERRAERVADGLEHPSPSFLDGSPEQDIVAC